MLVVVKEAGTEKHLEPEEQAGNDDEPEKLGGEQAVE